MPRMKPIKRRFMRASMSSRKIRSREAAIPASAEDDLFAFFAQFSIRTDAVHRSLAVLLKIGELIAVIEFFAQTVHFILQSPNSPRARRLAVNIEQFSRIFLQIEQLPLVDFVEVNQFEALGAHAIVRLHAMVLWIMIVAIIHRGAPISRSLPSQNGKQAP